MTTTKKALAASPATLRGDLTKPFQNKIRSHLRRESGSLVSPRHQKRPEKIEDDRAPQIE
jgi:hypothetical protein